MNLNETVYAIKDTAAKYSYSTIDTVQYLRNGSADKRIIYIPNDNLSIFSNAYVLTHSELFQYAKQYGLLNFDDFDKSILDNNLFTIYYCDKDTVDEPYYSKIVDKKYYDEYGNYMIVYHDYDYQFKNSKLCRDFIK